MDLNQIMAEHYSFMKTTPLLITCVILVGCGHQVREKPASEANRQNSLRFASASKRDIQYAIDRWSQPKIAESTTAENLSPEQAEKLKQYEALNNEMAGMQAPRPWGVPFNRAHGYPDPSGGDTNREKQYQALMARIEQARVPIASVLERRDLQAERIRHQYTPEKLVAEYVGDRFDVVIDSRDSFNSPVLYQRSGEVLDITEGVLKLFEQKAKP